MVPITNCVSLWIRETLCKLYHLAIICVHRYYIWRHQYYDHLTIQQSRFRHESSGHGFHVILLIIWAGFNDASTAFDLTEVAGTGKLITFKSRGCPVCSDALLQLRIGCTITGSQPWWTKSSKSTYKLRLNILSTLGKLI